MHKITSEKTEFTLQHCLYQFEQMPFRLCNAPATFQRVIDVILTVTLQYALGYLDENVIFPENSKGFHQKHRDALMVTQNCQRSP